MQDGQRYYRRLGNFGLSVIGRYHWTSEGVYRAPESAILKLTEGGLPESGPILFIDGCDWADAFANFKTEEDVKDFLDKWEERT